MSHTKLSRGLNAGYATRTMCTGRVARAVVVAALAISMTCSPAVAYATDEQVADIWSKATQALFDSDSASTYDYAEGDKAPVDNLPTKYDLRDPNGDGDQSDGVVTPSKKQRPWEVCWAFATIGACETSILSALGTSYEQNPLDLSERQLVNTVYSEKGAPAAAVGQLQAGEGYHHEDSSTNPGYSRSGRTTFTISLLASGAGLVDESDAPYRNEEGIKECKVTVAGSDEQQTMYLNDDQIADYEKRGATVEEVCYAGSYRQDGKTVGTTWVTSETLWGASKYMLSDSCILPSTRVLDSDGNYVSTNMEAVKAIKGELYSGKGVTIGYHYDDSDINEQGLSTYFDRNTWSHYTWNNEGSNHAVSIIGWDDSYSADKFKNTEGKIPEGNGAWLVKNSTGCESESFPNYAEWGIVENGEHTGCFWLSYYDKSIQKFQSYGFDVGNDAHSSSVYNDQYDYLPQRDVVVQSFDNPVSSANIFTASGDLVLRNVSSTTYKPNTTVTYQVYLLDDEAANPTDPEHATLAYTGSETYAYGGYHRISIDSESQVAMRKGQRYAVITTQKCDTDGKWYQGVAINNSGLNFHAKVNAGESWTGLSTGSTSEASASTDWSDWTVVAQAVKKGYELFEADNAPVRAFSDARSWASVDELNALEEAIARAREVLANAVVSADGSDVAAGEMWITQEQHDALAAAVEEAEAQLALAGSDWRTTLANTTPTSDAVNAATASLTADVHYAAGAAADADSAARPEKGKLAATGDAAVWALPIALGVAAAAAVVLITFAILRNRRR